jgi:phosphonate transport system substrate-binding protein
MSLERFNGLLERKGSVVIRSVFIVALCCSIFACTEERQHDSRLSVLRVGLLPDQQEKALRSRYVPLLDYLSRQINIPYELTIPNSYDDLLNLFQEGKIDLARFGGVTFAKAHIISKAVPLAMRDVDVHYTSLFISSAKNQGKQVSDFRGKSLAFGSQLSTSGHVMPRFFLDQELNIVAETFFESVEFSGRHDLTAEWVQDDVVDLGAVNPIIVREMLADGRLRSDEISIIWETPPFANYVWAVQAYVGPADVAALLDAFLTLSQDNEEHAHILKRLHAEGFLPTSETDYTALLSVIRESKPEQ